MDAVNRARFAVGDPVEVRLPLIRGFFSVVTKGVRGGFGFDGEAEFSMQSLQYLLSDDSIADSPLGHLVRPVKPDTLSAPLDHLA